MITPTFNQIVPEISNSDPKKPVDFYGFVDYEIIFRVNCHNTIILQTLGDMKMAFYFVLT